MHYPSLTSSTYENRCSNKDSPSAGFTTNRDASIHVLSHDKRLILKASDEICSHAPLCELHAISPCKKSDTIQCLPTTAAANYYEISTDETVNKARPSIYMNNLKNVAPHDTRNLSSPCVRKRYQSNNANFYTCFMREFDKSLEKQFKPLVMGLVNTMNKNDERNIAQNKLDQIQGEWRDLALICDHFLCYFFPIMTLVVCLLIFVNSPHVFAPW